MGEESLVAGADVCFDPNTTPHIVFAHIMAMLRRFELCLPALRRRGASFLSKPVLAML